MKKDKRSFFERITGSIYAGDNGPEKVASEYQQETFGDDHEAAQLAIDLYQTKDEIVLTAMIAGTEASDLDISITRELVTINGKRTAKEKISEGGYFSRELYWGSFSRTVVLPQEIDTDQSDATTKNGLLTIRMPKIDKGRSTNLKVRLA